MTTTKTIRKGTKDYGKVLALPGFQWRGTAALAASRSLVADRAERVALTTPAGLSPTAADDLNPRYSGDAMRAVLEVNGNMSMRDDGTNVSICYHGEAWYEMPSEYLYHGLPADKMPEAERFDPFAGMVELLPVNDPAPVKVTVGATLRNLPGVVLTRNRVQGSLPTFEAAEALAFVLQAGLPLGVAHAFELVVNATTRENGHDTDLSLWYPAANDDTAAGYGVTPETDPHAAAVARLFARAKVEAINLSRDGEAITVVREDRGRYDPRFTPTTLAPALPATGTTHVAHYVNGRGGGLRVIGGGAKDLEPVKAAACRLSNEQPGLNVRVYELATEYGPRYVYAEDGSGRVIDPTVHADQIAVYLAGQKVRTAGHFGRVEVFEPAPSVPPFAPMATVEPVADAPAPALLGVDLAAPGAGAYLAEYGTAAPGAVVEFESKSRAAYQIRVPTSGLERYARLYAAAFALRAGHGSLGDLYNALDGFAAVSGGN